MKYNNKIFEIKPLKEKYPIIGRDKEIEELIYRVNSGSIVLINGKPGSGKTRLLKAVIDEFKGEGKVIYLDGNKINLRLDISKLIKNKPKGMILLFDNVNQLSKLNNEKIKYYYDEGKIKSIIFTTSNLSKINFSDSLYSRIGNNFLNLKKLSKKNIITIIENRFNDNELTEKNEIIKIIKQSSELKEILNNLRIKYSEEEIYQEDLKEENIFCEICNEKLIKINSEWRCKNCDLFCKNCGYLLDEDDENCPKCDFEVTEK